MTHVGFYVDPITNDLKLSPTGELLVVTAAHAVGQHVRQRLKTFVGEWFLDTTAGMPWLDELLGQRYDQALAEAIVKAEILDTDGVREINSFSVSFERTKRCLVIKEVSVTTVYDEEVSI